MQSGIKEVGTVFVPVADQERSLKFFVEELGFEKRVDFEYGGKHRWIEVAPPSGSHQIALVPPSEGTSAGGDIARCALAVPDADEMHASLLARGVDVDPEVATEGTARAGLVSGAAAVDNPVPPQFFVRDPDGNRFLIVQAG